MMVITLKSLEDFVSFLDRRQSNEVFFYIHNLESAATSMEPDLVDEAARSVLLHFLGKYGELSAIFQLPLQLRVQKGWRDQFRDLVALAETGDIRLVEGRLLEVCYSMQ
jgi:hypothetical protein